MNPGKEFAGRVPAYRRRDASAPTGPRPAPGRAADCTCRLAGK